MYNALKAGVLPVWNQDFQGKSSLSGFLYFLSDRTLMQKFSSLNRSTITLTFAFGMTDLSTYSSQMGKLLKIGKHEFN
ncbi:hypothetical protein QUA41_11305 [Microcoleus sp. Pol11C1]|uniref:hypothetical protein n=1 Tax=Microcoleus sp. Pol11C1 TaxID=3055388 RepID=UPI002FD4F719